MESRHDEEALPRRSAWERISAWFPRARSAELEEERARHRGHRREADITPVEALEPAPATETEAEGPTQVEATEQPRPSVQEELSALRAEASAARTWARPSPDLTFGDPVSEPEISDAVERAQAEIRDEVGDTLREELGMHHGATATDGLVVHFHPAQRRIAAVRGPKRAAEKGTAITRIDRYAVDGMVFDRKRSGGSILIDQSGSMALSDDAVADALERFPALTVARYSGTFAGGTLCILAERGLLGELGDCEAHGGNTVDIEALSWLSRQPAPRVWVSDGFVNGGLVDLLGAEQAAAVITSLCQRRGILRVETFDDAIHVLRRGAGRGVAITPRDPDFVPRSRWR